MSRIYRIRITILFLVHGNWATWGVWSECTTTCGPDGMKERERTCTDPAQLHGGNDCDDTINGDIQAESCNTEIVCPGIIFIALEATNG